MTATRHTELEREIRTALHAAADRLTVDSAPTLDSSPDRSGAGRSNRSGHPARRPHAAAGARTEDVHRSSSPRPGGGGRSDGHRGSRRWILPAVAAAAVLAVVTTAFLVTKDRLSHRDLTLATTLVQDAGGADLGGIRFPVPRGWTAEVVESTPTYVRACIAETPSADCDGVTLTAALPAGPALPYSDPIGDCGGRSPYLVMSDRNETVGGRPGHHYYGWCGTDGGPVAHQWALLDQGLDIRTPAGRYEDQGRQIADGLDLSNWIREPGEQLAFSAMGSRSGGPDPQISEANGVYSIFGARFPVPNGWETLLTGSDLDVEQVCLARTPTPDCHGVTVQLSTPAGPAVGAAPGPTCPITPDVVLDKDISTLGGRPAEHLTYRCGATGERRQVWQLTDRSLRVWADAEFEQQGALVIQELDLHDWQRPAADPGDPTAVPGNVPAGTSAPASSESGDPTPTAPPHATVTSSIPAAQPTVP